MAENEIHIWSAETRIQDLPSDWPEMAQAEVRRIESLWQERLSNTRLAGAIDKFTNELHREWAIETGRIENLYDIDRGVTQTLIEKGFSAAVMVDGSVNKDPEYVLALISDQQDALQGLFDFVKQDRPLSVGYIRELHAAMTKSQPTVDSFDSQGARTKIPMLHGDWKTQPNYPRRGDSVYMYCPPEQTQSEMERLVDLHLAHVANAVAPEVEAAWLHHRFTQIHPFQDGNGRVARALATLVLIRARLFPLVVPVDDKQNYLDRLEQCDAGELLPLVRMISLYQQQAYRRATTVLNRLSGDSDSPA